MSRICRLSVLVGLGISAASAGASQESLQRLWQALRWSARSPDAFVQNAQVSGRLQIDVPLVDADAGRHADVNIRRFRIGARIELRPGITIHSEAELDVEHTDPFFRRLTDSYIAWSPGPEMELIIGKQSAPFTMDGQTSSKALLTIDRSVLANNLWFPEEYMPGVSISGRIDNWVYHIAGMSAGAKNRTFGDFDGGNFTLLTVGRDFSHRLGSDETLLRLNYVRNSTDQDNTFTRSLRNVVSFNLSHRHGPWGLAADVATGDGLLQQSDLFGLMVMPHFAVTEQLQIVGRYTLVESDADNGVRFSRYETAITSGQGDHYQEGYLGINYYVFDHELKIQSGIHYARMRDRAADGGRYSGWSWTTGLRLAW